MKLCINLITNSDVVSSSGVEMFMNFRRQKNIVLNYILILFKLICNLNTVFKKVKM